MVNKVRGAKAPSFFKIKSNLMKTTTKYVDKIYKLTKESAPLSLILVRDTHNDFLYFGLMKLPELIKL